MRSKELGAAGEEMACRYLRRRGYSILKRNYHTPSGEIDIIATKGRNLVFCEVKTRHQGDLVEALEVVDGKKQRRLIKSATHYLVHFPYKGHTCRFDVIALLRTGGEWRIEHVEDAFEIGGI